MSRAVAMFSVLIWTTFALAQGASSGASAVSFAQTSLAALTRGASVRDVTLMGTARHIEGSDDETGGVIAKALVSGEARVDFNYVSGQRSEVRLNSAKGTAEKWSGPDGAKHDVVLHNVTPQSPWFFPAILLQRATQSRNTTVTYAGRETRGGSAVEHLTVVSLVAPAHHPAIMLKLLQNASRVELYIDAVTNLPTALVYNTHPDKNLAQDIPVEVRFSDYRLVDGVQVPFEIKKYLNRTLVLDVQISSAAVNSGLSASSLDLQ